jgi:hypothetical protein
MRNLKSFLAAVLMLALVALPALPAASAHYSTALSQQSGTLERGYRTGYSDGYQEGYRDSLDSQASRQRIKDEDIQSDRGYNAAYGSLEDYRDGYVQGFKTGYDVGFDHQPFDSNPPANLSSSGGGSINSSNNTGSTTDDTYSNPDDNNSTSGSSNTSVNTSSNTSGGGGRVSTNGRSVYIPSNTVMRVELLTNLSTEASQVGDRFQARVLEPTEYQGAMIDGRVTRVRRPGKIKGTAELQLSFDQIRLPDSRWANLEAQVIEVVPNAGSGVGDVDEEGGVKGKSGTKDDVVKIGAGTGIGAAIGAILGGGKGAAIGAVIGGAIGTGGAISSRGSDIRLPQGQQLRIRTSRETRIP